MVFKEQEGEAASRVGSGSTLLKNIYNFKTYLVSVWRFLRHFSKNLCFQSEMMLRSIEQPFPVRPW